MRCVGRHSFCAVVWGAVVLGIAPWVCGQQVRRLPLPLPEARQIRVRDPSELRPARIPSLPVPRTVGRPGSDLPAYRLSLDDALRIALANVEVVRSLTGVVAVNSGRTIYDPAIANAAIDEAQGAFDPSLTVDNNFSRSEPPVAVLDPLDPTRAIITGRRSDTHDLRVDLSRTNQLGGTASVRVDSNLARLQPLTTPDDPLNPQNASSVELSYVQPLLSGGGFGPNRVPIVLARIDTERSFFQLKEGMQELVRGVLEAYWGLVAARVDVWARRQQVEQGQEAYDRAAAQMRAGFGDQGDVAQPRLALANFRANLVTAEANVLDREQALRNVLGLPPEDGRQLVPITPLTTERIVFSWESLLRLAQQQRPDLIELKLIIEADEQLLLQSENLALPRVDAVALYRWNGLEGEMPSGASLGNPDGSATDWTLGVNFSVPLGLRASRAVLRRQELVLTRDYANLDQGLHAAAHRLALSVRRLDQFYEEYRAFVETREAALQNLAVQDAEYRFRGAIFLNVLQAITDWGNAVSSEAAALARYNAELANLESETGTILETHGIRFFEERFGTLGPLGRLAQDRAYPAALPPTESRDRYPSGERPAEEALDLTPPVRLKPLRADQGSKSEEVPPPRRSPLQLPRLE